MRPLILKLLVALRIIPRPDLTARSQPTHPNPEELPPGHLVVVRNGELEKWTCFQCPGGCGEKIMLSMSKSRRPRWKTVTDWLGRPTVEPSIRQVNECRCHFWIREGRVDWCADSGRGPKTPEGPNRIDTPV